MKSVIILFFFHIVFTVRLQAETLVKVSEGVLNGTKFVSRKGREFSAFLGVPYAQPPIGDLRFKSPLFPKSWNEVRMAYKEANICAQIDKENVVGEEDCLYLNVFTPITDFSASMDSSSLLPVMIYIHGGGFNTGNSSSLDFHGPNYLLDKDIVYVSLNYRLGILGFLSTGDSVAPGNFGLKDQNMALKWVQKNINFFGGDPNMVTIFGESAGGASVTYHALSDKSNGLFHRYIFHSGSALVPWGYRDRSNFKSNVNDVGLKVGCPINDSETLVECLRGVSFDKLVNLTTYNILDFPNLLWIPTNEVESDEAFLTDSPQNLIAQNKMKDLPFISGTVVDEGLYNTAPFYAKSTRESLRNVIDKCIDSTFNRFVTNGDLAKFRKAVEDFYFNGSMSTLNEEMLLNNFTKFVGDSEFVYPVAILVEKMAHTFKNPAYIYLFGYRGEKSLLLLEHNIEQNIGVTHADELLYLFSGINSPLKSENNQYIIDLMIDLWTSFAKNGTPTSNHLDSSNFWKVYTENKSFLQIGNIENNTDPSVTLKENYDFNRVNFWKENIPLL